MFPWTSVLGTYLTAYSIQFIYLRLYGLRPELKLEYFKAGVVLTAVTLLIRVMDEFKDYPDDLINYPHRPLPSGRVERFDLKFVGWLCVIQIIGMSLSSVDLLIWSLVTLGYTGLMLKWFFIEEKMRKSLPLAFISHHPIILFNFVYLIKTCLYVHPEMDWSKAYLVLPICLIFTNWELVRKIRAPEQETTYVTYSQIFGPRPAITISLIIQLIFNLSVIHIFALIGTPVFFIIAFIFLQSFLLIPSVRFLWSLKLPAPLKPTAETQILLVMISLLIAAYL